MRFLYLIILLVLFYPEKICMQSDAYTIVNDMHRFNYSQPTIVPESNDYSSHLIESANEIQGNTLNPVVDNGIN